MVGDFVYFANCKSLEDVKRTYKRLAFKYHPDCGGDVRIMQEVNAEYERAFDYFKRGRSVEETFDEFQTVVNGLIVLKGITVELCGKWLWIGGDTYPHREELKRLGCRYYPKARMWYWKPQSKTPRRPRRKRNDGEWDISIDEIRDTYGSQVIID